MLHRILLPLLTALIPAILYMVYFIRNLADPAQSLFIVPSCIGIGIVCVALGFLHDYRVGRKNQKKFKNISLYFSMLCAVAFIIQCTTQSLSGFATLRPGSSLFMVNFVFIPIYLIPILLVTYCTGWLVEWMSIKDVPRTFKNIYFPILVLFAAFLIVSGRILIEYKPNLIDFNPFNYFPSSSIHYAAQKGNIRQVDAFLKDGVSINLQEDTIYKVTPLHEAALHGKTEMIEYLLMHGAAIDSRDAFQFTPLHKACQVGWLDSVNILVGHNADINAQSDRGITPLFEAARRGHAEIVLFLIENGANVNLRNNMGQTPIFIAVRYNYPEIVSILLKNGAKVDLIDNNGNTPVKIAQEEKYLEIEKRLRKHLQDSNRTE